MNDRPNGIAVIATLRFVMAFVALPLTLLTLLVACVAPTETTDVYTPTGQPTTGSYEAIVSDNPAHTFLTKQDVKVEVRVLEKSCFGSAGCNVKYEVIPSAKLSVGVPVVGSHEVQYEITGAEDVHIGTVRMTDGVWDKGSFHMPEYAQTSGPSAVLKARVNWVEVVS